MPALSIPIASGSGSGTVPPQGDLDSTCKKDPNEQWKTGAHQSSKVSLPSEHPARRKDVRGVCESTWVFLRCLWVIRPMSDNLARLTKGCHPKQQPQEAIRWRKCTTCDHSKELWYRMSYLAGDV